MARTQAFYDASRNVVAVDGAARADGHATAVDVFARVAAVGAAESATRDCVVAVDVAVLPTVCRAVVHVVASKVAAIAADASAVNHAVAVQIAIVAVGATLVAIRSTAAFAQGALRAVALA